MYLMIENNFYSVMFESDKTKLLYNYMRMYRFTTIHILKKQLDIKLLYLVPVLDTLENEGVIYRNGKYVHYTGDTV